MNRCLRQGFCSSWKYVFVCVLFFSSFYHIKTGQSDSGPPIFHPSLHRSSLQWTPFVLWGEIQSYTLCASLTEKSVNQPSDFSGSFRKILLPFNKQSGPPGWGQREAREVGRQKENRAERDTETKEEVDSFLTKFWRRKKQREKKTSQECNWKERGSKFCTARGKILRVRVWEYSTQWKSSSSYSVPIKVYWPGRPVTNYPSGSTYDSISMADSFLMSNRSPRISAKSPPDDSINTQPTLLQEDDKGKSWNQLIPVVQRTPSRPRCTSFFYQSSIIW